MTNRQGLKWLLLSAIIIMVTIGCGRDPKSNEDIFEGLDGQEGVYIFKVPAVLFLIMARTELPTGELVDKLGDIEIVKILMFDSQKSESRTAGEMSDEIFDMLGESGYEMIVRVMHEGSDFAAYILENDKYVSDLMVVVTDHNSVTGVGLSGRLDSGSISEFASTIDYGKLKELIDIY